MTLRSHCKYLLKVPGEESRVVIDERHPGSVYRTVKREWIHALNSKNGVLADA